MEEATTQEVQQAEVTAPEQNETASAVSVEASAPETSEAEQKAEAEKAKTFTQEELDAAIGKRLAREQRKWEREQAQRLAEAQAQKATSNLSLDQFETPEQYAEALAYKKAQELIAKQEQQRQRAETTEAYHDREEEARNKYDDFEQVAYNPRLQITEVMAEAIQSSDIGPDVAYYLGSNPTEAQRISRLSPYLQAKEIGRLEVKLANEPPKTKSITKAPPPINPVSPRSTGVPTYDLDDPRSYEQLGAAAWLEARREKAIRDAKSRH